MQLSESAKTELDQLTLEQRQIVLNALYRKLSAASKTGKVSYRYDVCAICAFMGSSEENSEACQRCFIRSACQEPFVSGFKEDNAASLDYFKHMYEYMVTDCKSKSSTLVVGGNWDDKMGRPSKIISHMAQNLKADVYNGGWLPGLSGIATEGYRLIVWMPNVLDNAAPKTYPRKSVGSVLVLSKVMREGYTSLDAAKRLFAAQGNAVIEIYPGEKYKFRLADALNNAWHFGESIRDLCVEIENLRDWTQKSVRVRVNQAKDPIFAASEAQLKSLLNIVHDVSNQVENELGGRYFGNVSTRCVKLFPSMQVDGPYVYVSPRNTNKRYIEPEDMVLVWGSDNNINFCGDRKPSVDAPVQLALYRSFPWMHYLIHGHAYVDGAPCTNEYVPCGDLREATEVTILLNKMPSSTTGAINLKNHGFLLFAASLHALDTFARNMKLINRL